MNCNQIVPKKALSLVLLLLAFPAQVLCATSLGTFSNYSAITIGTQYKATPYPSKIAVSGISGPVDIVRIKLNNMNHTYPNDIGVLLVGPLGKAVVLMKAAGGATDLPLNTNLTFDDTGSALTSDPIVSGIYRPTDLNTFITFPDPAPLATNANLSSFYNTDPNGTWQLFVRDDFPGQDFGNIKGGWQIEFLSRQGTSISVQPQNLTVAGGQTATLSVSAISEGTLSYQWYQGVSGITTNPIAGATSNAFTTPPVYGPTSYWVRVTSTSGQPVDSTTAQITTIFVNGSFSNSAVISINDNAAATPYPALIDVSGLTGVVKKVRVTLNNISHGYSADIGVLLVGPQGQKVVLMNAAGGTSELINVNLVFDDAGNALTTDQIVSGTYRPTNLDTFTTFPAPAPTGAYENSLAAFNGSDPNGQWQLYVMDAEVEDFGNIYGGWQIEFLTDSHSLKISFNGTGHGIVYYVEQGAALNTNYETSVNTGKQVTLQPSSDQYSLFTGWSGISSCTTGNCQFGITANTTATATFNLNRADSVLVNSDLHATIDAAYKALTTPSGATIKLWGINFSENLLLGLDKIVTLKGGYNGTHATQDPGAFTTITGNLKIKAGRVNVDRIIIK